MEPRLLDYSWCFLRKDGVRSRDGNHHLFFPMSLLLLISFLLVGTGCRNDKLPVADNAILKGKVVAISDGDTFTLLTEEKKQVKVRLHGIDCPEKNQPFGNVAKQKLSELIFGKQVVVLTKGLDRWKRVIGVVYQDEMNVNEAMLKSGMAWHYKKYDDNEEWASQEQTARVAKVGLWTEAEPTPPWKWRTQLGKRK